MIPYGRQFISQEDIEAVINVLNSDFLTQGPEPKAFEADLSKKIDAPYVQVMNSATSALHTACLALDVGPGDTVWTSPVSFVASANCALYCGAGVDFVDIDPETFNMCPQRLEEKLKKAAHNGKLPKVIIPVHMGGSSCEMEKISMLAKKFGVKVIEDASHAIGGKHGGKYVGSCEFSDIAIFSFHPVKIITTGEGGACLTRSHELYNKLKLLHSHGITREEAMMTEPSHGPWYYQQLELGFNYRMTDLQAALGRSQLKHLDDFVIGRHKIAQKYHEHLKDAPVSFQKISGDTYSAYHLFIVRLKSQNKKKVFEKMRSDGIGVNLHYIPIHLQPYYKKFGFQEGQFPESEAYYKDAISLPMFPQLNDRDFMKVINSLKDAVE